MKYSALVALMMVAAACGRSTAIGEAHAASSAPTSASLSADAHARVTIPIEGMNCEKCAANISANLKRLDGVQDAAVSFEKKEVAVTYDANKVTTDRLVAEINKLGFKAGAPVKGS